MANVWKLQAKLTSIYEGVKCVEYPNLDLLYGFIEGGHGIKLDINRQPYANELNHYMQYLKNEVGTGVAVKYNIKPFGRIEPLGSLSLSKFHRGSRHHFCDDNYIDFDMVGCQTFDLFELCRKSGIEASGWETYAHNSEQIRLQIIENYGIKDIYEMEDTFDNKGKPIFDNESGLPLQKQKLNNGIPIIKTKARDIAKRLPLRLCFGGKLENWKKEFAVSSKIPDIDIIKSMALTVKTVMPIIYAQNPEIVADADFDTPKKDRLGIDKPIKNHEARMRSVMGRFFQSRERIHQEMAIKKVMSLSTSIKLCNIVPCQDGLMILKREINNIPHQMILDAIHAEMEAHGTNVKWEIKLFNEKSNVAIIPRKKRPSSHMAYLREVKEDKALLKLAKNKQVVDEAGAVVETDMEASEIVYKAISARLVFCNDTMFFKTDNSLWIDSIKTITSILTVKVAEFNLIKMDGKGEPLPYSANRSNMINVAHTVLDLAKTNVDDNWLTNFNDSSRGKLLFQNGYYDFVRSEFIPRLVDKEINPAFDESVKFTSIITYNYKECKDQVLLDYVDKATFHDPLGLDVGEYTKQKIARAMSGEVMKHGSVLFGIGVSDSGKSFLGRVMQKACGSGYVGSFNGNNLLVKKFENADEAQALRWVKLLKNCRIIISQELGSFANINGETLKKLTGNDNIIARGHGQNEASFKFNSLIMSYTNDAPIITPFDNAVQNRVRLLPYQFAFKESPKGMFQRKLNTNLDAEAETDAFANAFITLLIQSFQKERIAENSPTIAVCIDSAREQFEGEELDVMEMILSNYEFTTAQPTELEPNPIPTAYEMVKTSDIHQLFYGKGLTPFKINSTLKKYALENNFQISMEKKHGFTQTNISGKESKIFKDAWHGLATISHF